ncbi:MAG: DUF3179 domain-containing protein [Planctomycetes bacterium]|nr:DUF3179 domain-containing protein [Planctomycetota bacterium]
MYASRVQGQDLTFVVSGMLWQRSLVMMDLETGSLWAHLLGRAMRGPLQGEELERLHSVMTDWKTWRDEHPTTTVLKLSRTAEEYQRTFYRDSSQFVLGIAEGNAARAWPFDQLVRQPVVNDEFAGKPLLIVFVQGSSTALAFDGRYNGHTLTFSNVGGELIDDRTGSQWDPASGKGVAGQLKGAQLTPEVGVVSYRRAWRDFHPQSTYWRAE